MVWKIFKPWTWFHRKKKETTPVEPVEKKPKETSLIGDPTIKEKVEPLPYEKRVQKVDIFAQVYHGPISEKVKARIYDEHWLLFRTSDRKKHEKLIADPPKTHEYTRGRWPFKKRVRELVFHAGYNAEATHDPARCQYDIPIIEGQIKMTKSITKGDILKAAADQVKTGYSWSDFIIPGMFFIVILFLIFAFQVQPNM